MRRKVILGVTRRSKQQQILAGYYCIPKAAFLSNANNAQVSNRIKSNQSDPSIFVCGILMRWPPSTLNPYSYSIGCFVLYKCGLKPSSALNWTLILFYHPLRHAIQILAGALEMESSDLQIKKGELAGATAMFIYESTSQVTTKDGTQIVVRYLGQVREGYFRI